MADTVKKGITIEINGDTSKFQESMTNLTKQINTTGRSIKKIDRSLKLNPSSTALLTAKQKDLGKAIELTKVKSARLKKELENMDEGDEKFSKTSRELGIVQTQLKGLEKEYKKFGNTQNSWAVNTVAFGNKIKSAGESIEGAGRKLSGLSIASGAVIGGSTKLAIDFQNGMNKVNTIANKSGKELQKLSDQLLNVSTQTGKSANEITEAAYQALSASIPTDQVAKFTKVAANLSRSGFTDTRTAVDLLTTAINAYGLKVKDATKLSDSLLTVQDKGKTTVGELGENMGKIIPVASALHVNFNNLAAAYISLTKQGINTASATTQVRSMLYELSKSGSKVDQTLRNQTGKSFVELMNSGKSLGDVIQILSDSVHGNSTAFKNLFSNQRASQGALGILNGTTEKFNQSLKDVENSAGKTAQNLKKIDTPVKKAERSFNGLKNSGIKLGQQLLVNAAPTITSLTKKFNGMTNALSKASPATKTLITGVLGVTAVASPAIIVIGKIAQGVGNIITYVPVMVAKVKEVGAVLSSLKLSTVIASLKTTAAAIWPVGAAVGAVGVAILLAKRYMSSMEASRTRAVTDTEKLATASNRLNAEISKTSQKYDDNISKINMNSTVAEKLAENIGNLGAKSSKTAADKEKLKAMVNELNSIMPGLNAQYDAEKDKLNMTTTALKKKIQAMQNEAVASLTSQQLAKKYVEYAKLEAQSIKEITQLKNNEAAQAGARAKLNKANADMEYASRIGDTKAYDEAAAQSQKYSNQLMSLTDAHKKLSEAHDKTTASMSKMNTEINNLDFTAILAKARTAGVEIPNAIKEGMSTGKIAIPQTVAELKNLIKFDGVFSKAKASGVKISKEMTQGMLSGAVSVKTATDYLKNSVKFSGLLEKAKKSGVNVPKGLAAGVASGKVSVTSAINQLDAAAKKHNNGSLKAGGSSAGKNVSSGLAAGIRGGMGAVQASVKTVGNKVKSTAKSSMSRGQGSSVGNNFSQGISAGIASGAGGVFTAVKNVANGMISKLKSALGIHSPSRITKQDGVFFVQGLSKGIENTKKQAEKSAVALGNATIKALNDELEIHSPSKKTAKSGKHVVNGLVKGVKSNSKKAKKAGKSLANAAANSKTFSKASKKYESATKTFSSKVTSTIKSMNDKINDLNKQYTDAVSSRAEALRTGLFDTYSKDTPVFGYTLTRNLQSQVNDLKEYSSVMGSLRSKLGRNSGLYKELEKMDVNSLSSLKAINQMSSNELKNYVKLYNERQSLSEAQAVKDNDTLKASINAQISQAKNDASKQIASLKNEYIKKLRDAGVVTKKQANKLGSQITSGINAGIKKGQTDLFNTINKLGSKMLKKLKKKLKIHSPSRAFRDEVGVMTAKGLALGIDKGAPDVYKSLETLSANMINTSAALSHDFGRVTTSPVAAAESNQPGKIDVLISLMTQLVEKDSNIYIDKKQLVGAVGDDMNRYLGAKLKML